MAEGGHTVFLIRDYLFSRLDKQAADFVDKPTPTAGAEQPIPELGDEFGEEEPFAEE